MKRALFGHSIPSAHLTPLVNHILFIPVGKLLCNTITNTRHFLIISEKFPLDARVPIHIPRTKSTGDKVLKLIYMRV